MDITDIVFLVLSFTIMIVPLVEKAKSKKKDPHTQTVKDLFGGLDEQDDASDDEADYKAFAEAVEAKTRKEAAEAVLAEEGVAAFEHKTLPLNEKEGIQVIEEEKGRKEKIDGKKLVIYSEILKPKF